MGGGTAGRDSTSTWAGGRNEGKRGELDAISKSDPLTATRKSYQKGREGFEYGKAQIKKNVRVR
jgi:hypothetical protein